VAARPPRRRARSPTSHPPSLSLPVIMPYSSMMMGLPYDFAIAARSRMKVFSTQRLRSSSALTFQLSG